MAWRVVATGGFVSAAVGALAAKLAEGGGYSAIIVTAIGAVIGSTVGWRLFRQASTTRTEDPVQLSRHGAD